MPVIPKVPRFVKLVTADTRFLVLALLCVCAEGEGLLQCQVPQ